MPPAYQRLLSTIKRVDSDIRFAVRCGSQVYGTAGPGSDEDFFVVLTDRKAKQDLAWGPQINVIVHGADAFEKALCEQSVFALECLFAPTEHRLKEAKPPFAFKLDRKRLLESSKSRSDSDYAKAQKRYEDEPGPSLKKVFHSIRVLLFARQLLQTGKILDYSEAVPLWTEMKGLNHPAWDEIHLRYGEIRAELLLEIAGLGGR